ncbi:MAG: helix-turn-helix domain-containing protein [Spirochaetales bacterium]
MIVDDDVETLQGLSNFIDWGARGFAVEATAQSAEQALPLIEKLEPDLLITDITMTGADGFSLLSRSRELLPSLEAIILTCHADFSFARAAIESDVAAYLTKVTLTEDELSKALEKVRGRLQSASKTLQRQIEIQHAIRALVSQPGRSFQEMPQAGLPLSEDARAIRLAFFAPAIGARTESSGAATGREGGELDLQEWLLGQAQTLLPNAYLAFVDDSHLLAIEPAAPASGDYDAFVARVEDLTELVASRFGADVTVAIAAELSRTAEPAAAYGDLRLRIEDAYYESGNVLLRPRANRGTGASGGVAGSVATAGGNPEAIPDSLAAQALVARIAAPGGSAALAGVERLLRERRVPAHAREPWERELAALLETKAHAAGARLPNFVPTTRLSNLIDYLTRSAQAIEAAQSEAGQISARDEINRVARYVRDHLQEPITAESMAELAGMSLAHFSRVFKREAGLTFSEFLAHKRVDAAKKMLRAGNEVIDEIARSTGFENAAYFYRVFKRVAGTTPGEFRGRA